MMTKGFVAVLCVAIVDFGMSATQTIPFGVTSATGTTNSTITRPTTGAKNSTTTRPTTQNTTTSNAPTASSSRSSIPMTGTQPLTTASSRASNSSTTVSPATTTGGANSVCSVSFALLLTFVPIHRTLTAMH